MSIYLVVTIIVLLSALACYAFISQSLEKRRIQKQRALMTLKTKQRNLAYMLNGFPPNFLSSDLIGIVYRALINTCEQLSNLEPEDNRHIEQANSLTNQLAILTKNSAAQRARLENPTQMKEIRQHLQELHHFVKQQTASRAITKVQAVSFFDQIKRLNLQMAVDTHVFHAKEAQQHNKARLAIHYFILAKKLLASENNSSIYDKQIVQIDGIIEKLEEKARNGESTAAADENEVVSDPISKEWENFTKPEENWKKKQVYD